MTADPARAVPGPDRLGAPRGMQELGAALGASVWWCEQIFTVTGAWVPEVPEAGVRAHLAELSRVAGEHALALRRHLPRPSGVEPESWVDPRGAGSRPAVAALAAERSSPRRLAALHRALVPHLLVAWEAHVRGASVSDRGVARTLRHAHADLLGLWHEGEGLLQALVRADPPVAEEVGRAIATIERHLATL